jgi:lysophospholipase L1-like esterase
MGERPNRKSRWVGSGVIGALLLAGWVFAQAPQNCADALSGLEQRVEAQRRILVDWAGLTRYGSQNAETPKPKADEARVIFLGDEIIERWSEEGRPFFPGKPYLNRGIAGQTTPQMLVRFRQDVIRLRPKAVVLLAGANDILSPYEPITQAMTAENITSMVELARVNQIQVVLCSLTPIHDRQRRQSLVRPFGKIIGINNWLQNYAKENGLPFVNFYEAMAVGRNLRPELSEDGRLPNDAGYAVMTGLVESAIARAIASSSGG